MPHLTLEYSANLESDSDLTGLFTQFHNVLAEIGKINLQNCKSRAYPASNFMVGAGDNSGGFVHLDVRFLEGRSPDVVKDIGENLLRTLKSWFTNEVNSIDVQITVEIQDISKSGYFKYPTGTFTPQ